jgi:RNA polymerase sigma-70 factor (ECF subfamily)
VVSGAGPSARFTPDALEGFRSYLLAVASRRLGSDLSAKVGASDLVQDTLLAAGRDGESFRGHGPDGLKPWLKGILLHRLAKVRRQYLDTARRRLGMERSLIAPGQDGPSWFALVDTATSASGLAIRGELCDAVRDGLARLPERHRRVLILRYREELTFEAIGERLGTSADAARKLWGRAIVRLRESLGPHRDRD